MENQETLNSEATTVDTTIQTDSNSTQNPQGQAEDKVSKEEYLNAQAFGTRARQAEIAMATKLVQTDGTQLHSIDDVKVRDAVTKQLLKMSYAEASAVLGANFDISKGTEDDSDDTTARQTSPWIERQLKLLQFKDAQREVDSAIEAYATKNPEVFKADAETMKEKIRSELENISTSLSPDERVRRAATVSLWNPMDKQSLAYNLLLSWAAGSPKGATQQKEDEANKTTKLQDELRLLWGIKQK